MTKRIRLTPAMRGLLLDMYETGGAYPLDRNHRRTFDALEELDYIEHASWGQGPHMSIDITQQALNALADAGLGNDSPAEAYVIGYTQGHDDALALAIQLKRSINRRPFMPDEAERLAMRLHEQVGDCPIAHESGKAMDDSEREWWVNLAASAWTLIDGTEETE